MRVVALVKRWPVGFRQFVKFNIVGLVNTAIDFAVFALLSYAGLFYLVSQICSYTCGLINSYILNRFWTFGFKGGLSFVQALAFVCMNLISLGTALGFLYLFRDVFDLHLLLSKLFATAGSLIVNFAGNKLWVFRTSLK